jgi:predicted amidohydrolase
MQTNWRITNGRIIDPANGVDQTGDLLIIAGRSMPRAAGSCPD